MRKYLVILALIAAHGVLADTFVVTSPLDNTNTGTLRWALQSAKDNGNQPSWDTIVFNIPSLLMAAHNIALLSELPVISSYLIIDGTTQPGGTFGISDAKIQVVTNNFLNCKRGFVLRDVDHVEIYGISFAGFINANPLQAETWRDAIFMWNVHDVIIGAPGRGNSFFGCYHTIRHEPIPEDSRDPPPPGIGHHISIQGNYIGRNNTGRVSGRVGVVFAIEFTDVNNVTIGGYAPRENNEFMVFVSAIQMGLKTNQPVDISNIIVVKNTFVLGTSNPPLPVPIPVSGISINDNNPGSPGIHHVNISWNDLQKYSTGISLSGLKHSFQITNNRVNCDQANSQVPFSTAISAAGCDSGMIGGHDSSNLIHDSKNYGIKLAGTKYIQVSENSIYCHPMGISITAPGTAIPKITDLYLDPSGTVFGKTCPRCKVEVFSTTQCPAEFYNGEVYKQSLVASALGDWSYPNVHDCFSTSFTTTNLNTTTSEFYVVYNFILDTSGAQIHNASCGQANGSITGIKIFSGVDFFWQDLAGNTVGTDTNLVNMPAGFYRLVGTKQNVGCQLLTGYYEIKDVNPIINASALIITYPYTQCNQLGSINGITVEGAPASSFAFKWTNQLGAIVGTSLNLVNVPPGNYTFTVWVITDPTCIRTAGPYTLNDHPAPVFNLNNVQVIDATCGLSNGSISGITILNPTGAQIFKWKDALGNVVGTSLNLSNIVAGSYRLEYDDGAPCSPITTPFYQVVNHGLVTIDETNEIIIPSGCTIIKGAIKNIIVTGANNYQWINTLTGAIVGNSLNLVNVPAGTYQLTATDNVYNCTATTGDIIVPLASIQPLTVQSKDQKDETCSGANGYITNIILNPQPVGYILKWIKNVNDTFAFTLNVTGLSQGDYELIAIDSNGCTQSVLRQTLTDHPSPVINESGMAKKDDQCTQSIGSIQGITVNLGDAPLNYQWYNSPSNSSFATGLNLSKIGSGDYYLVVSDKNGCRDTSSTVHIKDISLVIPPPQYEDTYAKRNSAAHIKNMSGLTGAYEIFDTPNGLIPILINTTGSFTTPPLVSDKDYWVRQTVGSCVSARARVHVYVIDYSKVFVPNAFTPNNDGLNDVLKIKVYGKIIIDGFRIFNRWGQQIFFTNDVNKGWDGTVNGKLMETGTYTWFIQGYDIDGTPINMRGTVSIIH